MPSFSFGGGGGTSTTGKDAASRGSVKDDSGARDIGAITVAIVAVVMGAGDTFGMTGTATEAGVVPVTIAAAAVEPQSPPMSLSPFRLILLLEVLSKLIILLLAAGSPMPFETLFCVCVVVLGVACKWIVVS